MTETKTDHLWSRERVSQMTEERYSAPSPLKTPADLEQTLARLQNDLAEVNTGAKYIIRALLDNDRDEKILRLAREFLGLSPKKAGEQ